MKNGIALLVAMILGVLGFAAMYIVMSRPVGDPSALGEPQAMTGVVVARRTIKAGTKLEPADIEIRDIPTVYASGMHIKEPEKTRVLGRTLRTDVAAGEPILMASVEAGITTGGSAIADQLRYPDTHAVALALDEPGSIAGLIRPGQKVDVIGTFDIEHLHAVGFSTDNRPIEIRKDKEAERAGTWSFLLMQNRTVLAVDVKAAGRYDAEPKDVAGHVVTIAVTADEAIKIAMLQAKGRPMLALRNPGDATVAKPERNPISPGDLFPQDHWYLKHLQSRVGNR